MVQRNIPRRDFLLGAAGAAAFVSTVSEANAQPPAPLGAPKPLPDALKWKSDNSLMVHSANTIETRRGYVGRGALTPLDELFVRNNVAPPPPSIVDQPDDWEISIDGVESAHTLSVGELKRIGVESIAAVLQCSGNGRKFFDHAPSGTAWTVGAAGCVLWTGVPVRALVERLGGTLPGCQFMTGTGGEPIPQGLDVGTVVVERSVPIEAMEMALLAWEANGKSLPLAHGGPLRLIIPGYFGINNIKYIKKLAFTQHESQARIQAKSYRMSPLGGDEASATPSMWQMPIKSLIRHPIDTIKSGRHLIQGVMFGGEGGAKSVEISIDGGATWKEGTIVGPNLGKFAWRTFVLSADLPPGNHLLVSRATDEGGNRQPEHMLPNKSGYAHNGWRSHGTAVAVT